MPQKNLCHQTRNQNRTPSDSGVMLSPQKKSDNCFNCGASLLYESVNTKAGGNMLEISMMVSKYSFCPHCGADQSGVMPTPQKEPDNCPNCGAIIFTATTCACVTKDDFANHNKTCKSIIPTHCYNCGADLKKPPGCRNEDAAPSQEEN